MDSLIEEDTLWAAFPSVDKPRTETRTLQHPAHRQVALERIFGTLLSSCHADDWRAPPESSRPARRPSPLSPPLAALSRTFLSTPPTSPPPPHVRRSLPSPTPTSICIDTSFPTPHAIVSYRNRWRTPDQTCSGQHGHVRVYALPLPALNLLESNIGPPPTGGHTRSSV